MHHSRARTHVQQSTWSGAAQICERAIQLDTDQLRTAVVGAQAEWLRTKAHGPRAEVVLLATCKLVHKTCTKEYFSWEARLPASHEFCDVFQAGSMGVMHAIKKYDAKLINPQGSKPYAFTTYASKWIRQAAQRNILNAIAGGTRIGWNPIQDGSIPRDHPMLAIGMTSFDLASRAAEASDTGRPAGDELVDIAAELEYLEVDDADAARSLIEQLLAAQEARGRDLLSPAQIKRRKQALADIARGWTLTEASEGVGISRQGFQQWIDTYAGDITLA